MSWPPKKLAETVNAALAAGRSFLISHGKDTGDNPFVSFAAKWEGHEVQLTWHTRQTGTYRLFTRIARTPGRYWHDVTLTRALELIRQGDPDD